MADNDVKDFLTAWNLVQYIEVFSANDIDMKTLPFLKEDMIKELIPSIGHRARFISNLDEWRTIIAGIQNTTNTVIEQESCSTSFSTISLEHSNNLSEIQQPNNDSIYFQLGESSSEIRTNYPVQPVATTVINEIQSCKTEVLDLLKSVNEGKALLAIHQERGQLDSLGRRRLCNIIINNELKDDVQSRVPTSRLHDLAYQITTIFPKEHIATYFIPYISYGPGLKKAAKGKLLDYLYNRRRDYRRSGLIHSSRHSTSSINY